MLDIKEAEKQAISLYHDLCKQYKLPQLKLSIKTRESEKDSQGEYDGKEISIFILANESKENILKSVRHEFRHQWQDAYHHDMFQWWRDNYNIYAILMKYENKSLKLDRLCYIEADAERFAQNKQLFSEEEISKFFSVEYLEKMKTILQSRGIV